MRTTITAALVFFSLLGSAEASTLTAFGAVKALNATSQVLGLVGTASFDEGPTSGNVPLSQYTPQGMTFGVGNLSTILAGVTTPGVASNPIYTTPFAGLFPTPIGGGGVQVSQLDLFGGVATFTASTITQVGLTASTNGDQYLTVWNKSGAMIGQVNWHPTGPVQFIGIDTLGVPIGMVAYGNDDLWAGGAYDISGATIYADTWMWATGKCAANAQCDDQNVCTTDTCTIATGACVRANNTVSCTDSNSCTQNDVCSAGACVPGAPVVCAALDGCHTVGVCNPMSGVCSTPIKPNGSACNDANACTQTDTCSAGVCNGQSPVMCPPPDACHSAGSCNMATGMCSNPALADGTACNDSNACTQADSCQVGVCTGLNPVTCSASDLCHAAGVCDTTTGACSNPAQPDNSACDDGDSCTQTDVCKAGTCFGQTPVVCTPANDCQVAGTCDPTTGVCANTSKPNGTTCDDANSCTKTDTCMAGLCAGGATVTCAVPDACHDVGVCDPASGTCSNPAKADGAACDDAVGCTKVDSCTNGVCAGTGVVCKALDACHTKGACSGNGVCSNPSVTCPPPDSVCKQAGSCDLAAGNGSCAYAAKPDGAPCGNGVCVAGLCSDEMGNTTTSATSGGMTTGAGGASGAGGAGGASSVTGAGGAGGASGVTGAGGAAGPSATGATSTSGGDGSVSPAGGCGCSVPESSPTRASWLLLGLLLPIWRRRRRTA